MILVGQLLSKHFGDQNSTYGFQCGSSRIIHPPNLSLHLFMIPKYNINEGSFLKVSE
jgi:hypothetical protein